MKRRLLPVLLAVVTAGLVGVAARTADAGQTPAPSLCAEGELTPYHATMTPIGNGRFLFQVGIRGWIRACADADPDAVSTARLTWARYYAKTASPSYTEPFPARFERVELTRAARAVVVPTGGLLSGLPSAVCMVTGMLDRVACLGIDADRGQAAGVPRVAPIPTDDPRVRIPVLTGRIYPPDPSCPSCV